MGIMPLLTVLTMGFSPLDFNKTVCAYGENLTEGSLTQLVEGDRCPNGEKNLGRVADFVIERQAATGGDNRLFDDWAKGKIDELNS